MLSTIKSASTNRLERSLCLSVKQTLFLSFDFNYSRIFIGISPFFFDAANHSVISFDCLVFGTEKQGISPEIMAVADEFVKIPMYGFVESLNVSACAAILIQGFVDRLHRSNVEWHLSPEEQSELLYRWMRESVKDDEGILRKRFGEDI